MSDTSQAPASEQYESWLKWPSNYKEPSHSDWLRELAALRAEKNRLENKSEMAKSLVRMARELESAETDIARLRAGIQWYADGKHMMNMDDWDIEEGWLCSVGEDGEMVEPGNVAKAILDGKMMNPDPDGDQACIEFPG